MVAWVYNAVWSCGFKIWHILALTLLPNCMWLTAVTWFLRSTALLLMSLCTTWYPPPHDTRLPWLKFGQSHNHGWISSQKQGHFLCLRQNYATSSVWPLLLIQVSASAGTQFKPKLMGIDNKTKPVQCRRRGTVCDHGNGGYALG
jgi:hypothetical protein